MGRGQKKVLAQKKPESSKAQGTRGPLQEKRIEVKINGVRIQLSQKLKAAVEKACKGISEPQPPEMTTTQAAEFLDVSRPFVIKLVRKRILPCRMVGKHRRIPTVALQSYKEKMFHEATSAANEMTQMSQELHLYDLAGQSSKAP